MKNILLILLLASHFIPKAQNTIVNGSGSIVGYCKYSDSNMYVSKNRGDSLQNAIAGKQASGSYVLQATTVNSHALSSNVTVTASDVGLGNVTNESKATMFTSPTFTGTPVGIGIPVYARVTGSNVTTTGQSLTNITGLSVALAINATYEFQATLSVSTTAVTTGTEYGVNYSVAGGAVEAQITGALTNAASKTERINALNTATSAYLTTSAQTGGVTISGIVTTGANAGNFTISHLKVTSGTSTVFINSFLKVTRIL